MKCSSCQGPVAGDQHICPNCGADLTDVVVGGESVADAPRRTVPSWLAFVGVAAAVIAIGLGAWAFTGSAAPATSFASHIPAEAIGYTEIDVAELASDRARSVVEAFAPMIEQQTGEAFDFDSIADKALAQLESELDDVDLSFDDDIAPWASGKVAIGVLPPADDIEERGVMIVSGRNADALDSFIGKLSTLPGVTNEGEQTLGDLTFATLTHEDETFLVTRSGTDLLVASDRDSDASLATTTTESSFASVPEVAERLERLDEQAAVVFAFNPAAVADEAIERSGGELGLNGMTMGWTIGSASVTDSGLQFEWITESGESGPPTFDPQVVEAVPADTVAFFRAGSLVQQLEQIAAGDGTAPMLGSLETELGFSLTDILAVFSRDAAIAIWPSTQPELPVNAALIGVSDSNQSDLVDRIAALAPMMGIDSRPIDGGYSFMGLAALGTRENLTLLTSDPGLLSAPPANPFTDGALYDKAQSLVGGDLIMAVDLPAVIDLVDGLVAVEDPEAADLLRCLPFGVLAGGVSVEGTDVHGKAVVEIAPRC